MTDTLILKLTTDIVAAHVSHNHLTADALPELIKSVYASLVTVSTGGAAASAAAERPSPAVPIKKSVFPNYIVCLEDGKHLKMLKRHLETSYNLTPEKYREKWDLPASYPMVAPNYAKQRSALAKQIGLGRKPEGAAPVPVIEPGKAPARRGRPQKPEVADGSP